MFDKNVSLRLTSTIAAGAVVACLGIAPIPALAAGESQSANVATEQQTVVGGGLSATPDQLQAVDQVEPQATGQTDVQSASPAEETKATEQSTQETPATEQSTQAMPQTTAPQPAEPEANAQPEATTTNTVAESSSSSEPATSSAESAATPASSVGETAAETEPAEVTYSNIYRLYNPYSGQHLYSRLWDEVKSTTNSGWYYEGIAWEAPDTAEGNTAVYRLYNPYSGDHHYTTSAEERDNLVGLGWNSEGTAWYSPSAKDAIPLFRLFNPYATVGTHHYTTSATERDYLKSIGWNYEGEAWYGVNQPAKAVGAQWIGGKNSLFYVKDDGTTAKGMFSLGGNTYYAESNGRVLTSGGHHLNGKWYIANSNGTLTETTEATAKATNVLDQIGWNLPAAFNYSVMHHIDDEENGYQTSGHYFLKGISQGQGNCYVMAGTFCTLARTLGYNAVQISGGVLNRHGGYNAHSWVEIDGRVYDASYQSGTHRNGYNIPKIGAYGSGQWVYKNYRTMQP